MRPDAEEPGYAEISFETEDGEAYSALVSSEIIRDALQLQGVDTNEIIEEELQESPTPEEVEDALDGEGIEPVADEAPASDLSEGDTINAEQVGEGAADNLPAGTILAREDGWKVKKALDGRWYVIPQGKKKGPFQNTITDRPQGDDDWSVESIGTTESLNDLIPIQKAKELNFQVNKARKDIREIPEADVEARQAKQQEIDELEQELFETWGDARQAFALLERRKQLAELRKRNDLTDEQKAEVEDAWTKSYDALIDLRDGTTDKMSKADNKRPPKVGPEPSNEEYEKLLQPFDFEDQEEVKDSEDIAEEGKNFPPYGMPGSDEVPNSLPETLPEGWSRVEGDETMIQYEGTNDYIGLVDREGAKYWYVLTGNSDDNKVFQTPEEAIEHYNKLRESIADVGAEQEPDPVTDTEAPAAREDLPDAGDVEIEETERDPAPASKPDEEEEAEAPEDETPRKEMKVQYLFNNGLVTLKGGIGAPFRDPEIQEYIRSKGFNFVEALPNGKRIYSETAEMSLPEFKEVLRELRDRFGVDLSPRFEGRDIDIDAPEEAESPTVEPGGRVDVVTTDRTFNQYERAGTVASDDLDKFNELVAERQRLWKEWKNSTDGDEQKVLYRSYARTTDEIEALFTPNTQAKKNTETTEPSEPIPSRFGGDVSNEWVDNDENAFDVNDAPVVGDIQIGDFIPAADGGWHEVINLEPDPDDPDGTIVTKMRLSNGEVFRGRKTTKRSPGLGWANGKEISGLRRRKDFDGLSRNEIEETLQDMAHDDRWDADVEAGIATALRLMSQTMIQSHYVLNRARMDAKDSTDGNRLVCYIDYRDASKGYSTSRKAFYSADEARKWAKAEFESFNEDMINYF